MPSAMANEAPFDPCASEQVAAYVRGLPGGADALTTRIHPADEMYRYELGQPLASRETAAVLYFSTASQIFRALAEVVAWRFGWEISEPRRAASSGADAPGPALADVAR